MSGEYISGVIAYTGAFGALPWIGLIARASRHLASVSWIRDQPAELPDGDWPSLAVIFAARNEEAAVERATRSLLAQDFPGLEVIAVDDRSTDRTGAILDELARENPRLRVVHIRELPRGWLGKTNALQTAAAATTADWLLFTDGDVVFAPLALRRSMVIALRERADLLATAPETLTESFLERVFIAFFCLVFALHTPPWRIVDRRSKASIGTGAFNLVRASAFRAIGGFDRVALSIDDDLRLGQALKFAGYQLVPSMGKDAVSVRWQFGIGGHIRGLEKNFFAALDFRWSLALLVLIGIAVMAVGPFLGLFFGPWWTRALCGAGIIAIAVTIAAARRQNGMAWYHGLFTPLGGIFMAAALVLSVWSTVRRGGVSWRDTFYPLSELRAHVWLRNTWLREVWLSTR